MRRGLKIAAWSFGGLLALAVLLAGALLVTANTEAGRALIVRLTAQLTGGHIRLAGLAGSLPADLELERLELSDARGVWLYAEHIRLRWSPVRLLARHVQVDSLQVSRLHVERSPVPGPQRKPSGTPSIPHVDVSQVSIDALELGRALAGSEVSLLVTGKVHLASLQDATADIAAQRTGGVGNYELKLHFDPSRMDATLKLREPAHGPLENLLSVPGLGDLSVLVKLSGPRDREDFELTLEAGNLSGRVSGAVDLTKASADLSYSLSASRISPYPGLAWQSIDLRGRWQGTIESPSADGRLQVSQLEIPDGVRVATLKATLAGRPSGLFTAHATVDGLVIPGPQPTLLQDSLTVDASTRFDNGRWPIEAAATHRLFALQAHAIIAGDQSARVSLQVPDVAPFAALAGQTILGKAKVNAQIDRHDTALHVTADASGTIDGGTAIWASLLRGGNSRLQLSGELDDREMKVERLQLTGPAISLSLDGTFARSGPPALNTHVNIALSDLTVISPVLAGTLQVSGTVNGTTNSLSADLGMSSALSVHGTPTGKLSATLHADGVPKSPRGTLEVHGSLDEAPVVLNLLVEQTRGDAMHIVVRHADWKSAHISGEMTSGADLAEAQGRISLSVSELSDLDRLLDTPLRGSITGNVALSRQHAKIEIDAHEVAAGAITADARLNAEGTMDALNINLTAQSPSLGGEPASLNSTARLAVGRRELRIESGEAGYHGETIRLISAATLSFAGGLSVDRLRLADRDAVLDLAGRIAPALELHASLRQLKPELINIFAPGLLASGTVQADAEVRGRWSSPTGIVRLDATGLRAASDAAIGLPATDIHATADLLGDTASVNARLTAGSASQLTLTGRAPLSAAGALDLKLTGGLDMGLLNPLLEARGRHVNGTLTVDTTVTGAAGSPEIGGNVRLVKATLRDYTQGTNLTDINGELSGGHGLLKIESLTARAAPGNVSVTGTIGVLQPQIPVDLKVTARNAQPIANNIITANLNADVRVSGTARERLNVAGNIGINRADVEIPSGLPPNVAVLDVRRPGRAAPPPPEKPLVVGLDITVDAPRQILVRGRGLDAEMGGQIRVRGTTDSPAVSGAFELQRGFFTLASSRLTFSNGSVTFNGAGLKRKIDPSLDFTAQSQVSDATVIVRITGLADSPKIELTSTPELPQDEILARLLFGESASQLTALQAVQIGAALATLGGGGGLNPVARIQKALGLDRLAVAGGTTGGPAGTQTTGTSIEAGRYVSSRVFVAVKHSTTGTSQLAVDVDLTRHLKLQTRLGNGTASAQGTTPENDPGSSVGLAYQFEY